jgi:hypothetical protein
MGAIKDGYVGLFVVPDSGVPVPVLTANGTVAVIERVRKSGAGIASTAELNISGVTLSVGAGAGNIQYIGIERANGARSALNAITFRMNPVDGDTITTGGASPRIYMYKNALTAINQIKIGATLSATMVNTIKTINLSGVALTNYYTGQVIDPNCSAIYSNSTTITLKALITGTAGNAYTLSATSTASLSAYAATFSGGAAQGPYFNVGQYNVTQTDGTPGWKGASLNSGTFQIAGMETSPTGLPYQFKVKCYNSDGQQAVNAGGAAQYVETASYDFNGISDLAEYAEVIGLQCVNAANTEGSSSTPSALPPGGVASLQWTDMKTYTSLIGQKLANGDTANITAEQFALLSEYVVFMYIANGSTAPAHLYPDPAEVNGNWYLVARTSDTHKTVNCPINAKIAFWVGFGTQLTGISSKTPLDVKLTYTLL